MNRLKHLLKIVSIGIIFNLVSAGWLFADFGPLQTTNRFPLHMLFLKPRPVRADLPSPGDFEGTMAVEYSNTFFDHHNSRWDGLMDMEMLVNELSLVYGFTSKMAFRIDLPVVSMGGGFLDGFLENYHNAIGVSNYGRENRPKNSFEYHVSKNGKLWVQGDEEAMQLSDMTVSTQIKLFRALEDRRMSGSLLLSLKLPTGNRALGLSSGQIDAGIYLPLQWSVNPWSFFAMPGAAFIHDPDTRGAHISARNNYSMFAGMAYDSSQNTTWLVQLNYYTSPFEETGLNALDKGALELAIGFYHRLSENTIMEFAFCEDLTLALPDFNLRLGLHWTWPQS